MADSNTLINTFLMSLKIEDREVRQQVNSLSTAAKQADRKAQEAETRLAKLRRALAKHRQERQREEARTAQTGGRSAFLAQARSQSLSTARGIAFTLVASESLRAAGLSNALQPLVTGTLSGLAVGGAPGAAIGAIAGAISSIYALISESSRKSAALELATKGAIDAQVALAKRVRDLEEEQQKEQLAKRGREFLRVGRLERDLVRNLEKEFQRLKAMQEGA